MRQSSDSDLESLGLSKNYSVDEFMRVVVEYKDTDHWFSAKHEVYLIVAYCFVIFMGLCENALVCFAVCKNQKLRSSRNFLIVNLSICDIIMCVVCMPFSLIKLTLKNWYLGEAMCKIAPSLQTLDVFVSTFTIASIAIDRYRAIVCSSRETDRKVLPYLLVFIWILSVFMCIPMLLFHRVEEVNIVPNIVSYGICMEVWPSYVSRAAYTITVMVIQYVLPLIVVSVLHARICNFLRVRIRENGVTEAEISRAFKDLKRHKKNMLLLTAIAMSFAITWLPLTILNVTADFDYRIFISNNFNLIYAICLLVAMSSACINPIIYGWFNSNFRNAFIAVLCCREQTHKENSSLMADREKSRPKYSSFQSDSKQAK